MRDNSINNPKRILDHLDRHLQNPLELTIYGRAALALGFTQPKYEYYATKDVDAIIPITNIEALQHNEDFWNAQDRVNKELESESLYITHVFSELDVIIRPNWMNNRVGIPISYNNLRLFRPATLDLILTKMMRDDLDDLADIQFMLESEPLIAVHIPEAITEAKIPNIPELLEQFENMKIKVIKLAYSIQQHNALHNSE